jgi:hypothetical protein
MAKDDINVDDNYEMGFDEFMEDGESQPREPASNAREAVSYAISDTASGLKEGFSKANLTTNLKALTANLAPSALDSEFKKINGIKSVLDNELTGILKDNKDKIANISGFIKSKTKSGGLIHRLATNVNDRVTDGEQRQEESVESIAQRVVSSELDNAMVQMQTAKIDSVKNFTQQEALNRIYTTLLKTDVFNRNITTTYYRKSLEYQYIHLTTAKRMHDVTKDGFAKLENALSYVVKNTGLPDIVKLRSMEAVEAQARNRMIDAGLNKLFGEGGWVGNLATKIKSKREGINEGISGVESALDSYQSAQEMNELMAELGGGSTTKMVASTLPSMMMGGLGKYISNKISKTERGSAMVDYIKDMVSNPTEALKNSAKGLEGGGSIYSKFLRSKLAGGLNSLGDFLDTDALKKDMMIPTKDLSEAATIDRKTLITQNEVVPSLLSKIFREIHLLRTGKDEKDVGELKFDYNSRSFSTAGKMATKLTGKISKVIKGSGAAADIATMSDFILSKSGEKYDDKALGDVRSGIASFLQTGKSFKPTQLDDDFYKHFSGDSARLLKAGMDAINDEKNINRGKERSKLRDSFSEARGKIPNMEAMINAQIDSGNTDLLVQNGLIKFDEKLGRYRVNSDTYDNLVKTNLAMYQGRGYGYNFDNANKDNIVDGFNNFRAGAKEFRGNVGANMGTGRFVRTSSNIPKPDSMFTLNRSGTNSMGEYMTTEALRKAQMGAAIFKANPNVKKVKLEANQYMANLSNSANQFKDNLHRNLTDDFLHSNANIPMPDSMFTLNRSGTNSIPEYLATQAARKASIYGSNINQNEYVKRARASSKPYIDKVKHLDISNITTDDVVSTAKDKFNKAKSYMANTFSSRKAMTDEFSNLGDTITTSLVGVKESKRFKILEKIVKEKVNKLNIGTMKKLNNKDILEMTNILTNSKTIKELKSKALTYLFTAGKISETTITENMIDINSNATVDPDTGVVDPSTMSLKDRIANKIKTVREMGILGALKNNRDSMADKKQEVASLEEAIEKKEDSRIQSIVTNVIEKLGLAGDKTKSGDSDKDGVRDGSWMSRLKGGKSGNNQSTDIGADIAKKASAEEKSNNPMWTIAKLLLMGVPMLISTISGMFGNVGTIMTAIKAFPSFISNLFDGLGGKLWDGIKWLGGGIITLGSTVISGLGTYVVDLGKAIGSNLLDLGKSFASSLWDMAKSLGGYILDMGKSLGTFIGDKLSGAFNSLKSVFGFGDDIAETAGEMDLPEMDDKDKPKNLDKDGKPIDDKDKKDKKEESKDKDGKSKTKIDEIDGKAKGKGWWSKAKGLGKSIMNNKYARKIPIAGAIISAGYAASQFAEGDMAGGIGSAVSGLVGSIPIVGTPLSYGIDYATEKYKEWNPNIDKKLYTDGNYPNITVDAADQITLNHIRKQETGSTDGKYGLADDIGDGAGISFGTYQFTEKSGNLKEYLTRLVALTNDPVGQNYLSKFEDNEYTGIKSGLEKYLRETGDTPAGRYIQDLLYKELFLEPAKELAASYGITNPASVSQIIDHSVNAGLGGAKRMLYMAAGNYTPENIAKSRKLDYMKLITNNSKLSKYQKTWFNRVDANAEMFNIAVDSMVGDTSSQAVAMLNNTVPPIPGVDTTKQLNNGTPATNSLVTDATKLSGGVPSGLPNMVANPMTTINTSMSSQSTGLTPTAPVFNTSTLEKLINDSNTTLKGIQQNTTNMLGNHAYLVNALKALTEAVLTGKKTVGPISKEIIKTPMGEGVSLSKGTSLN